VVRSTCQRSFGFRVVTVRGAAWRVGQGLGGRVSRNIRRTVVDPRWRPARARIWAIFTFPRVGQRILRRLTR